MDLIHKIPATSPRLIVILFFGGLTTLGLFIFKDYGFAQDEHINRENGAVTLRNILLILERLSGTDINRSTSALSGFHSDLFTYRDRDYRVAFDLPAMLRISIFQIEVSGDQFF